MLDDPYEFIKGLFNVLQVIFFSAIAWIHGRMNKIDDKIDKVENEYLNLKVYIAENYLTKVEFGQFQEKLFNKLDRIDDKLDSKADKN